LGFGWLGCFRAGIVISQQVQHMQSPIVSVVMPLHNARPYVAKAIDSILRQTFSDFEFIIVDDGSTDGSSDIAQRYAARDSRIRLVRQANTGVSAASNAGISMARGEFIARMDHDDISVHTRLQQQVKYLQTHAECVAVGGQAMFIDELGLPLRLFGVPLAHEAIDTALLSTWGMFHPTMMARTEALRAIGGYSLEFCNLEDLDVFLKLAEFGRMANLPGVLVHYRQHFRSICHSKAMEHHRLRRRILEEASKRRGRDLSGFLALAKDSGARDVRQRSARWRYEKMWAWWALESSFLGSARRHALKALLIAPFEPESWVLLVCALRGH
jgi:glycosyltransferase involved in cell wall biosynthesis